MHRLVLSLVGIRLPLEAAALILNVSVTLALVLVETLSFTASHSLVLVATRTPSVLLRIASLVLELVLLEALSVIVHIELLLSATVYHGGGSIFLEVLAHHGVLFVFESHVLLVAVLPLLRLQGHGLLFRSHWVVRLPQFCISVGVMTLVSESTIFVRFVVSTPLSFVLVIDF